MVMCCPDCKGMLHPVDNNGEMWRCEDCSYTGPYPRLSKEKREDLVKAIIEKERESYVLSLDPQPEELLPYVRLNIKRKRLRKKFLKRPMFYAKRLPKKIITEYTSKRLGNIFKQAVWDAMNREGFARRALLVKPLPECEVS